MKHLLLVLSILALATPLAAQQKRELFAFVDDPTVTSTDTAGTKLSTGYGLALRHFSSPQFSTELSIARHYQDVADPSGASTALFRARLLPVDLIASYHFGTNSRLQPFAGIGVHRMFVSDAPGIDGRTRGVVTGGVEFLATQQFFIRADFKHLLGNSKLTYDPDTRGALGIGWRF